MSASSEDEAFNSTARSGTGGAIGITSLGAIIQSLNKRYEVYQRRLTAMTPFPSPMVPALGVPPTPHSILGDSAVMAGGSHHHHSGAHNATGTNSINAAATATATATAASAAAPGGSKPQNACPSSGSPSAARRYDTPHESIVPAHARPAPYWEERELYICAEDLCCYLNGGINYRVLCEQYQRALEVLLTLVREDVRLCASGGLEVLPGGATAGLLAKLRTLLKESVKLLDEAGVHVPPRLAAAIDHLPSQSSHANNAASAAGTGASAGGGSRSAPTPPASAAAATAPAAGNAYAGGRPSNSSIMSNGRLTSICASPMAGASASASPNLSGAGSPGVAMVSMLAPATSAVNYSAGPSPIYHHGLTPVPPTSSQPQPAVRRPVSGNLNSAAGGDLSPHYAGAAHGSNGGSRLHVQTPNASPTHHLRRHPSNPPVTTDARHDEANVVDAFAAAHGNGGSILRSGSLVTNSGLHTPTKVGGGGGGGGVARKRSSSAQAERRHLCPPPTNAAAAAGGAVHRGHAGETSPIPSAPTSRGDDSGLPEESGTDLGSTVTYPNVVGAVAEEPDVVAPGAAVADAEEAGQDTVAASPARARLRRLEELYGELYAMDGMSLLTDALGVVFTREYDQGPLQQYKHGFTAFQRDVQGKVTPALQSYEALQLRITDLAPLRSSYLASCLVHRVRPNNTVLEHLKRIDHDRSAEAMLLAGLHLGDRGVAAVVDGVVPRLYRLRRLDLSENDMTDAALEAVFRATRYHPALEHLNLSRNPITDASLPYLLRIVQTLPRLSELLLQSCAMKPATRAMVETELAEPGTYAVPQLAPRRGSLTTLRQGSAAAAASVGVAKRKSTASAPRGGAATATARPSLPLLPGDRQRLLPQSVAVRAESVPTHVTAAIRRPVLPDAAAKPSFPRGLGVALDPIHDDTPPA